MIAAANRLFSPQCCSISRRPHQGPVMSHIPFSAVTHTLPRELTLPAGSRDLIPLPALPRRDHTSLFPTTDDTTFGHLLPRPCLDRYYDTPSPPYPCQDSVK